MNIIKQEIEIIESIDEKIEPNTNLKHARIIAQPLQRSASVCDNFKKIKIKYRNKK